jgi:hypothetical protein
MEISQGSETQMEPYHLRDWSGEGAAERRGVLSAHYSGIRDAGTVKQYPDWARVNADGLPVPKITSIFGPSLVHRSIEAQNK